MFSIHKFITAFLGIVLFASLFASAQANNITTSETTPVPTPAAASSSDITVDTAAALDATSLPVTIDTPTPTTETSTPPLSVALDNSLSLIGIRYKRGGQSPLTGFDCSGFVGHVFREGLGVALPRSAKEISKTGETIKKEELKPGDLVFFNTMRRAFSHVGIYLGADLFVHSPRTGGKVRVDDMSKKYWTKSYNGARRFSLN